MILKQCDICSRKFSQDRLGKHLRACENQLRGQWKHDEMMKRAQSRQLANIQFHEFEKRYQTHKWKDQHAELDNLFSDAHSAKKLPNKDFELIHIDFNECNTCHRMFHPDRIIGHTEHCIKTHQKPQQKVTSLPKDKLNTLAKSMQNS